MANAGHLRINRYTGLHNLPYLVANMEIHQGISFNILCLGETGLGKSTLMETLLERKLDTSQFTHDLPDSTLTVSSYYAKKAIGTLKLSIIESCRFGNKINKEDGLDPIISYIEDQFEKYLQEEMKINRNLTTYQDTRVHVCLYFIALDGHNLNSLDLVAMKKLENKVNIIPLIAKSDTMTQSEIKQFKTQIMKEIQTNQINIYQFPTTDDSVRELNSEMNQLLPFAVVGCNELVKIPNGNELRARQHPWGMVQIDNENHCDFVRLRNMLFQTNMDDLRQRTHSVHYETYRQQRLREMGLRHEDNMSIYKRRKESQNEKFKQKKKNINEILSRLSGQKDSIYKELEEKIKSKLNELNKVSSRAE